MVRAMWWLAVVLALVVSAGARAQYQGYLPVQSGGCEQPTVTFRSNTDGEYMIWQRDLDTVLVGYPPYQREMQVVDTTCYIEYIPSSGATWWVSRIEWSLSERKTDGTHRWHVEGRARQVTSRSRYHDRFELRNFRTSLDPFLDAPLPVTQTVYVEP